MGGAIEPKTKHNFLFNLTSDGSGQIEKVDSWAPRVQNMLLLSALHLCGSSVKRADGHILCKHCPCPCPSLSVGFAGTHGQLHCHISVQEFHSQTGLVR